MAVLYHTEIKLKKDKKAEFLDLLKSPKDLLSQNQNLGLFLWKVEFTRMILVKALSTYGVNGRKGKILKLTRKILTEILKVSKCRKRQV